MSQTVKTQPRRFYDGGVLAIGDRIGLPPDPGADPRIVLERHLEDDLETFSLERRIAYRDRHLGEILVPASPDFRTDLTSTPALFTWLVPKTGAHLPAALVHDALAAAARRRTNAVVVVAEPGTTGIPLVEGRGEVEGGPAAYVCRNHVCGLPVTDAEAL